MSQFNIWQILFLLCTAIVMAATHSTPSSTLGVTSKPDSSDVRDSGGRASTGCVSGPFYCRGARIIRNVIHNLGKSDKPIVIFRGLEIVPSQDKTIVNRTASTEVDDTFVGRFSEYLRTHELNVKFSDLLTDESEWNWNYTDRSSDTVNDTEEGRKKDKGQGMVLAMAMMMGKMMAVLGLGGIGALAMKALGVAMMALVMAGLVGLKSLSQHGGESSHSVSYVTGEGHHHKRRRRRNASQEQELAYKGWLGRLV